MDPFSIAVAIALMLGSAYYKNKAVSKTMDEQRRLATAERMRQGQLEEQKQSAIQGALPKLGREAQEGQQQSIAQQLTSYLTPQSVTSGGDYGAQQNPGAPQEIQDAKQAAVAAAADKGRQYASRLADLSSFNLLNFGNSALLGRTGEAVSQAVTGQTHSSQILPFELQAAPNVARNDVLASDITGGLGTIAGMYALSGPTTPAAGDMGGGTGITVPNSSNGYSPMFSTGGQGLRVGARPGLRLPNMYGT